MKLKKALSQRIKALREAAGLSQQDVAMKGDLSLSLVAKLEQGKKADPRTSTLLALAFALGVRPGQLLDDLFPAHTPIDDLLPASEEAATISTDLPIEEANGHAINGNGTEKRSKKKEKKKKKKE